MLAPHGLKRHCFCATVYPRTNAKPYRSGASKAVHAIIVTIHYLPAIQCSHGSNSDMQVGHAQASDCCESCADSWLLMSVPSSSLSTVDWLDSADASAFAKRDFGLARALMWASACPSSSAVEPADEAGECCKVRGVC